MNWQKGAKSQLQGRQRGTGNVARLRRGGRNRKGRCLRKELRGGGRQVRKAGGRRHGRQSFPLTPVRNCERHRPHHPVFTGSSKGLRTYLVSLILKNPSADPALPLLAPLLSERCLYSHFRGHFPFFHHLPLPHSHS